MSNEEFLYKLQQVLVAMSEIWDEPQWEDLNEKLLEENYGYVGLTDAQISFARAESLLNPSQRMEHIGTRIDRWKQEAVERQIQEALKDGRS
ncbi:hypothetical protein [Scytonema sp. PCC 10023]|uniref:hypothetical protein n=1 Tax=Scytonema sp. PCC 10023 TaxID=1680591 RepID=UPI0039C682B9